MKMTNEEFQRELDKLEMPVYFPSEEDIIAMYLSNSKNYLKDLNGTAERR